MDTSKMVIDSDEENDNGPDEYEVDDFVVDTPEEDFTTENERKRALEVNLFQFDDEDDPLMRPRKRLKLLKSKKTNSGEGFIVRDDEDDQEDDQDEDDFIVGSNDTKKDTLVDEIFGYSFQELIDDEKKRKEQAEKEEDSGVSSAHETTTDDIHEDEIVDEIGDVKIVDKEEKNTQLNQFFSHEELKRKFLLPRDKEIKYDDKPETLQEMGVYRKGVDENELKREASWIAQRMDPPKVKDVIKRIESKDDDKMDLSDDKEIGNIDDDDDDDDWALGKSKNDEPKDTSGLVSFGSSGKVSTGKIKAIEFVLTEIHVNFSDIPYISLYLKDRYQPYLEEDDLWKILDLDLEWKKMSKEKEDIKEELKKLGDKVKLMYLEILEEIQSPDMLVVFREFIRNFRKSKKKSTLKTRKNYIPRNKKDLYKIAKETEKLVPLLKLFGLTSQEYAENLHNGFVVNNVNDWHRKPIETSSEFTTHDFSSSRSVLNAAQILFTNDLIRDPVIIEKVRLLYNCFCKITTKATELGQLNDEQWFRDIKNIAKTPINVFNDTDESRIKLLSIFKAEKDGLLKVIFHEIDDEDWEELLQFKSFYLSEGVSETAKLWNKERCKVIQEVKIKCHDMMKIFLKQKYQGIAKNTIKKILEKETIRLCMTPPFKINTEEEEDMFGESENSSSRKTYHKILGCISSTGPKEDTVFILTDEQSNFISSLKWSWDPRKIKDESSYKLTKQEQKLVEFLKEFKPHAIAIGATSIQALITKQHLDQCLKHSGLEIQAYWTDPKISRVYSLSQNYKNSNFNQHETFALSLSRWFNDPLMELCRLFDENDSIVSIILNKWQKILTHDEVLNAQKRGFIRVINNIGVDLNRSLIQKENRHTLKFVSGLGPRKANSLYENIQDIIFKRDDLVSLNYMGEIVYRNCCGFLLIKTPNENDYENNEFYLLDSSRVHPDDYFLARKICTDALDAPQNSRTSDEQQESYIAEVMQNPGLLDELDLDAYAIQLEESSGLKKATALFLAKNELKIMFKDPREDFQEISKDGLFNIILGDEISIGSVISGEVIGFGRDSLYIRLDNGLVATSTRYFMDNAQGGSRLDSLHPKGSHVTGKVHSVDTTNFTALLDLRKKNFEEERTVSRKKRKMGKKEKLARNITHPSYHNFDMDEAKEFLKNRPIGDPIVRPSYSLGINFLCITFRFFENTFLNLNVREEQKAGPRQLGKVLRHKNHPYSDLEELYMSVVSEIMNYAETVVSFRKYRKPNKVEIYKELRETKQQFPKTIPYLIAIDNKKPEHFIIYYLPGTSTVIKQRFAVTEEGFILHDDPDGKKVLKDISDVVDRFKRNFKRMTSYREYIQKKKNMMSSQNLDK